MSPVVVVRVRNGDGAHPVPVWFPGWVYERVCEGKVSMAQNEQNSIERTRMTGLDEQVMPWSQRASLMTLRTPPANRS